MSELGPRAGGPLSQEGFTLLEVLVALAILALALAAALESGARGAADIAYLRDKTFADWVAANELTRIASAREWPEPGRSRGAAWMGDREWPWELQVSATNDENVRQLELRVGGEGQPLVRLTAYAVQPHMPTRSATPAEPGAAAETGATAAPGTGAGQRTSSGRMKGARPTPGFR